jgi:hypothetical protein
MTASLTHLRTQSHGTLRMRPRCKATCRYNDHTDTADGVKLGGAIFTHDAAYGRGIFWKELGSGLL